MSVNQITLIGNIGKDIKMTGSDENPIANFSIATEHSYKSKSGERVSETDWHNVVAFGQTAKFISTYASTGRQAYVQGRSRNRKWTDKDGNPRTTHEIIIETFNLLGNKPADGQRAPNTSAPTSQQARPSTPSQASTPVSPATPDAPPFDDMDDHIPF